MMRYRGYWQFVALGAALALLPGTLATARGPVPGKKAAQEKKSDEKADTPKKTTPAKPDPEKETAAKNEFNKQVNQAVDKAVQYMRKLQRPNGAWGFNPGSTPLAALALLEGGVPPDDEAMRKAAAFVRQEAVQSTYQYGIALTIMFLDRLGDEQDVPFIEALAVRLLGGQIRQGAGQAGGWSYSTARPLPGEVERLTACIRNRKPPAAPEKAAKGAAKRKPRTSKDLPRALLAHIQAINQGQNAAAPVPAMADNSNTQFALLALWVARRHGIPVEPALELSERRLRGTQFADGSWAYRYAGPGQPAPLDRKELEPTAQMTCCGLIGLALAHGGSAKERDISKNEAIVKGLKAILGVIGTPVDDLKQAPRIPKQGEVRTYYTLWCLERTAVIYDLPTIGGKDWYKWGAQTLLANQNADGSWSGMYTDGGNDTCFALLFLKRANVTKDLTERMRKDPNRPKLLEPIQDPARRGAPPGTKSGQASPPERGHPALPARHLAGRTLSDWCLGPACYARG